MNIAGQAGGEAEAARAVKKHFDALAVGEAYATQTFWPGCRACGHAHPRAMTPPLAIDHCPRCGAPSGSPRHQLAPAKLTLRNGWGRLAGVLLAIGRRLHELSERTKR